MSSVWFAGALALYWLTGERGLAWADSSKLTFYAGQGNFPSLNAGDHAGWTVVAWAWLHLTGGDAVAAAHRLSAVAGALAVAFAALLVLARGGDRARAHTAAALLMLGLPHWWSATVAETYAPALAATLAGARVLRAVRCCSRSSTSRSWRSWSGALEVSRSLTSSDRCS